VGVAAVAQGRDGVGRGASLLADAGGQGPDVGGERVGQEAVRAVHVALGLRLGERGAVDEERLRVGVLDVQDGAQDRLDLRLDVVALVDRDAGQLRQRRQLGEDGEQRERVDGPRDEVVVAVPAVVRVEAAEQAVAREDRDDLLDVHAVGVVAEVDEDLRALADLAAEQGGGAPVGEVGRVERGLVELVLDEQGQRRAAVGARGGVQLLQGLAHAVAAGEQVVLADVVRAVGEPQGQRVGAGGPGDLAALEQVVGRLAADPGVGVRDRAELVVDVLEEVRVDRADGQAAVGDLAAQGCVVVDGVPRDVERDAGGRAGEALDLGGVVEALEDGARTTVLEERGEAGAGVAEAPGRDLHDELGQAGAHGGDVDPVVAQAGGEVLVVGAHGDLVSSVLGGQGAVVVGAVAAATDRKRR
jgi:hypothetical protein